MQGVTMLRELTHPRKKEDRVTANPHLSLR